MVTAAGITSADALCAHVTIRTFADVAGASQKQSSTTNHTEATGDGTLRESQVGAFGTLSKLPNPKGLEIDFIPSLDDLQRPSEQGLDRQMNPDEIEQLKQKAAVIALSADQAEAFKRARNERKGQPSPE